MFEKTEKEIMADWSLDTRWPLVSICCTSFNHADYIEEALDSFLMQVTDFPFEIVIHDDASTDRTPDIIRAYAERFPAIIRVLQQTENQYSKNPHLPVKHVFDAAHGQFIALCEGDDYWINPSKLSLQFGTLLNVPQLYACTTFTYKNMNGELTKATTEHGYDLTLGKFCMGKKAETRTLTNFFRAEVAKDFKMSEVSRLQNTDNYIRYLILRKGDIRILPVYTGVYRLHAGGVWSSQNSIHACRIKVKDLAGFCAIASFPYSGIFLLRYLKAVAVYQAVKLKATLRR